MKISRLKITVDKTVVAETHKAFAVRVTVEMRGPDVSVLGEREHLLPAAHHAIDLAERQLNERMRSMDAKRHHPHPVELDAEIPKTDRPS